MLFMEAQGYPLERNVLLQDNKSAILLESNGRMSCSKRSRHLNIRYFYVKDLIDKGLLEVEYYPTEQMLADFFTKPLQGSLFWKFRAVILGHEPVSSLYPVTPSLSKEHVGTNKPMSDER